MLTAMLALALTLPPSTKCDFDKLPSWARRQVALEMVRCSRNAKCAKSKLQLYSPALQKELHKVCVEVREL